MPQRTGYQCPSGQSGRDCISGVWICGSLNFIHSRFCWCIRNSNQLLMHICFQTYSHQGCFSSWVPTGGNLGFHIEKYHIILLQHYLRDRIREGVASSAFGNNPESEILSSICSSRKGIVSSGLEQEETGSQDSWVLFWTLEGGGCNKTCRLLNQLLLPALCLGNSSVPR